ncbi:hypothetical protein SDC9_149203 [bioreactor metagenome]|uniref:Uncharacterized protein n=1 Tax=bioreactor metagenome TaxID=1076179 RepID=A0A645EKY9_9ZZZZ
MNKNEGTLCPRFLKGIVYGTNNHAAGTNKALESVVYSGTRDQHVELVFLFHGSDDSIQISGRHRHHHCARRHYRRSVFPDLAVQPSVLRADGGPSQQRPPSAGKQRADGDRVNWLCVYQEYSADFLLPHLQRLRVCRRQYRSGFPDHPVHPEGSHG